MKLGGDKMKEMIDRYKEIDKEIGELIKRKEKIVNRIVERLNREVLPKIPKEDGVSSLRFEVAEGPFCNGIALRVNTHKRELGLEGSIKTLKYRLDVYGRYQEILDSLCPEISRGIDVCPKVVNDESRP